jgi:hypothetical protein
VIASHDERRVTTAARDLERSGLASVEQDA